MKFREFKLESGVIVLLGKDAESNDELVKEFEGKENIILHTFAPGSPFCVITDLSPSEKDISESGAWCARFSQDWRDNKSDVKVDIFTGKDVKKKKGMKAGMWEVKKCKMKTIKKKKIEELIDKDIKRQ